MSKARPGSSSSAASLTATWRISTSTARARQRLEHRDALGGVEISVSTATSYNVDAVTTNMAIQAISTLFTIAAIGTVTASIASRPPDRPV